MQLVPDSLAANLILITHNPQPGGGYDGQSASEARRKPQSDVQASRKGCGASARTHVCTARQSQPELCA